MRKGMRYVMRRLDGDRVLLSCGHETVQASDNTRKYLLCDECGKRTAALVEVLAGKLHEFGCDCMSCRPWTT